MKHANSILSFIIGLVVTTWITLVSFIYTTFGNIGINQLLFVLQDKNGDANTDIVGDYFRYSLKWYVLFLVVFLLGLVIVSWIRKHHNSKMTSFIHRTFLDNSGNPQAGNRIVMVLLFSSLVIGIFLTNLRLDLFDFYKNTQVQTDLYENYYVDPQRTVITFPEKKQNLIYIVLESMSTNLNAVSIDGKTENLIPNLETLMTENTHFSTDEKLRGPFMMEGLSWTAASLVGQNTGVPLKSTPSDEVLVDQESLLPGAYGLGQILEKEGYTNTFMVGSNGEYGARKQFFEGHGNYDVIDTKKMKEEGLIPEDYHVFWGVEDSKLFGFAKEWLEDSNNTTSPFNLTLLSVDTHFMDGYTDASCDSPYSVAYANAYSCSDTIVSTFIQWIQEQPFYENTTIVLVGDHDTMNQSFVERYEDQDLTLYYTIINPVHSLNEPKYREYNVMDLFPTTLSALGADIEGNRLGLGTDLFSPTQTLTEELGYDRFTQELKANSDYYNNNFVNP